MDNAMAQVVDKYAQQIADALREVAPQVWRAAYLQAIGGFSVGFLIGLALLVAGIACRITGTRKKIESLRPDRVGHTDIYAIVESDNWRVVGSAVVIVGSVLMVIMLVSGYLCVPMYTVQNVVNLLKPGQ